MKYPLTVWRAMLLAISCVLLQQSGFVLAAQDGEAAPLAGARPAMNALTAQPVGNAPGVAASGISTTATPVAESQGNVAELMQMIHGAKLNELRTTYNGSYGASLFFYPQEMTYYVALFQDKHFWRVIKSEDAARAELIYADFVLQTAQLAEVEIRRTQLLAQKVYIEDIIALSEDRAKRLQADLDVARAQQARVNDYQRQTQSEAAALRLEREKAQAQLRRVQGEVLQLQRQTESGLPLQK
ncbi:DUF2968 domain-containing protein [Paraburkholderia sp. BCC1876]|uniref:DUF2968 domain-containing protein n=1 Tax=Paraburkholderia sp. BCC1876 TaxID=2676303 RepID=UPI0015903C01|nr:DUF2968 domain-containing protein [Paraburkholderia sp. BCC1876]